MGAVEFPSLLRLFPRPFGPENNDGNSGGVSPSVSGS